MPNPENLKKRKSFTKNDPRINKAGRPKMPDLRELLDTVLGEEKDGITAAQAILMALRAKASKGDIRAAEVLMNRGYGLPKQNIGFTDKEGNDIIPITFILDERYKKETETDKDNAGIPPERLGLPE